jgi:bacterioferritin-associated ferredoxin
MYVCLCHGITDRQVRHAIREGACSAEQVMECTAAGTCCGGCRPAIAELVERARAEAEAPSSRHSLPMLPAAASSAAA